MLFWTAMLAGGCASAQRPARSRTTAAAPVAPAVAPPAVAAVAPATQPTALLPDGPPVERIAVPLGGPQRGPSTAKVTIVEFSDFQCPFCARVIPTLEQLRADYPNDVRILFRHNPLPFHDNAALAAEATVAAEVQGKFWEMHDKLFNDQRDLDRATLELHAAELGLDGKAFRAALDGHTGKVHVDDDLALGGRLGVRGTPSFFINGRPVIGAQPIEAFKKVIDDEIARADSLLRRGLPPDKLYATLLTGAKATMREPEADAGPPPPAKPTPDPDQETRYRIDIGAAPVRGAKDAPITIVEWADFQCPFCGRAEETLRRLGSEYPDKIRFVWRDMPLPFHQQAMPAAIAARAAGEQGKFWAMHDRLMAEQADLDRPALEKHAAALGLEMKRFRAALDADKGKAAIDADATAGTKIGAVGTPSFFVNGKPIRGAQPYETFKARVDAELRVTDALLAKGTPRARLYAVLMKDAQAFKIPSAKGGDDAPGPEADAQVYPVKPGDAPAKGPADAPLVMVVFSDFQCPFCKRVEPTLADLQRHYGKKLRVVWKNYPLPFHNNAAIAAEAAMAADAQGKFWQMHDKLFDNNTALDRESLEGYAAALNLDLARFKADLDSRRFKPRIEADTKEGTDVGVNGTPAVFINGRKIAGAYPLETFQKVADQELAKIGGAGKNRGKGKVTKHAAKAAHEAGPTDAP
jgi:protein-disulfide isomerase